MRWILVCTIGVIVGLCGLAKKSDACPRLLNGTLASMQEQVYGCLLPPLHFETLYTLKSYSPTLQADIEQRKLRPQLQTLNRRTWQLMYVSRPPTAPPRPVVVFLNKCGNGTVLTAKDAMTLFAPSPARYGDSCGTAMRQPGWRGRFWSLKAALDQGFDVVTFHESDVAPDHALHYAALRAGFSESVLAHPPGVIAAWASGLESVVRYLRAEPAFQNRPVGVMGHSRRGKAALLATAVSPQIDFVVAHQTGTLGMASVQDRPLESLEQITRMFPHWFTPGLRRYHDRLSELCCNQTELIRHMAPRPVLATEGYLDPWASYWLSLKTLQEAQPAYGEVYAQRGLASVVSTYHEGDSLQALKAPLAHAQAVLPHTMHPLYWRTVGDFLRQQFQQGNRLRKP